MDAIPWDVFESHILCALDEVDVRSLCFAYGTHSSWIVSRAMERMLSQFGVVEDGSYFELVLALSSVCGNPCVSIRDNVGLRRMLRLIRYVTPKQAPTDTTQTFFLWICDG
jgi:hypothetical protein